MFDKLLERAVPATLRVGLINVRHIPFLVFAYATLLPRELRIVVLDATLLPFRVALLAMIPFAIANIAKYPIRPSVIDALALFSAVWFPIALNMTTSLDAAMITGGSVAIDIGLSYIIGRSAIRTPQDFRTLFLCFLPGIFALFCVLALESLSRQMLMRPFLASVVGDPELIFQNEVRFGLMRAMGPFPHPILAGAFLAGMMPLAWYLSHNKWQRLASCGLAMGVIFSVSSAAFLGLIITAFLIGLDALQRLSRLPVFLVTGFYSFIMFVAIASFSQSGALSFIVRRLTFDPQTGFYRMLIWEYGGAEAMANPIFGIGQREWIRPLAMPADSVDAYWLFLSMFYGFPVASSILLMMVGAIIGLLMTQKYRHIADGDCAKGVIFFLIITIFLGFTVHFWDNLHVWIIGMVGAAVSLATQARTVPAPTMVEGGESRFSWMTGAFRRPGAA